MEWSQWIGVGLMAAAAVMAHRVGYRKGANDGNAAGYYAAMKDMYAAEMGIEEDEDGADDVSFGYDTPPRMWLSDEDEE